MSHLTRPTPRRLSVANISFLNSSGFRILSQLDWIDFAEFPPAECARKLQENEVDFAVIPIVEFVSHGGFRSLPYGICADGIVDSVMLFAERPLEELTTIYVDQLSRTSVVLLKVLVADFFPDLAGHVDFIREDPKRIPERIGKNAGGLVIGDNALELRHKFPIEIDLALLWKEKTGLPFIFALWAYRPEHVSADQAKHVAAQLKRSLSFQEVFARDWAEQHQQNRDHAARYVIENIRYEFDDRAILGAREFLSRARRHGLVPAAPVSGPFSEVAEGSPTHRSAESLSALLARASMGERISFVEALRLAEESSLTELALAADLRRLQLADSLGVDGERHFEIALTNVCELSHRYSNTFVAAGDPSAFLTPWEEIREQIDRLPRVSRRLVTLTSGIHPELDLLFYIELISWLKSTASVRLSALSADEVLHFAQSRGASVTEVLGALKRAQLDSLGGRVTHLLVEQLREREGLGTTSAAAWLDVHRKAHITGLLSECHFPVRAGDLWADRLVHLMKCRALQDETNGFTNLVTVPHSRVSKGGATELLSPTEYLRAQAIARLFIDNIQSFETTPAGFGMPVVEISLHFGANNHLVLS